MMVLACFGDYHYYYYCYYCYYYWLFWRGSDSKEFSIEATMRMFRIVIDQIQQVRFGSEEVTTMMFAMQY